MLSPLLHMTQQLRTHIWSLMPSILPLSSVFDLPDMFVEIFQFINDGMGHEARIEDVARRFIRVIVPEITRVIRHRDAGTIVSCNR